MSENYGTRYGPWALVTGASSGIGTGFAEELAARGLNLALAARRVDRMEELAARLADVHGIATRVIAADLCEPQAPAALADQVADLDLGLVVSNAGFNMKGTYEQGSASRMARMLMVNCHAPMQLAHALIPGLKARASAGKSAGKGAGLIITASVEGLIGCPYSTAYSATKALVVSLCEGLWGELTPHGVEVLALCPGATESEATLNGNFSEAMRANLQPAREVAALALDNVGNGPSFVPSERYRGMFEALRTKDRREALVQMEESMRFMA